MSNSFGYDVSITPSPLTTTITLSINTNQVVQATLGSLPSNLDFSLTPTGDFGQQIEDAILTPLIGIGSGDLISAIKDAVNGKVFDLITIGTFDVQGFAITPSGIALGSNTTATGVGMLQLTGTLTLSAA